MLLLFLNSWYNSVWMESVKMSALTHPHLEKSLLFKIHDRLIPVCLLLTFCWMKQNYDKILPERWNSRQNCVSKPE